MADASQIDQLHERRGRLLAQSEQLRQELAGHVARLHEAAAWVDTGYSLVRSVRSWWPAAAAVAGFLLARKRGGWLRAVAKIWSGWRLVKSLAPLWR